MELERAVNEMMVLDIKQDPSIPPEAYPSIRDALTRMYMVGFETSTISRSHTIEIMQYTTEGKFVRVFESVSLAARFYKVDKTTISKAVNGKIKTACGFVWRKRKDLTNK